MQELANSLIDSGAQCWACPVFDSLFAIISKTAAAAYQNLCILSVLIFCILLAFYILSAVWQNIKSGVKDTFLQSSVKPVIIKSMFALALLSMGLLVPKFISMITFEPVAEITLEFSKSMLPSDYIIPEHYQAIKLDDSGFFNPGLRDTILKILETGIANFQVYIKTGFAIIDSAFSLSALLGIGALIRHFIIFFIGLFLTYNFIRLFIKYSLCFMDIIVAMMLFAFFFPFSLVFFIFKDAQNAPGWMKKLGGDLGAGQIKHLINAIVSVAATILTYTIITMIIRSFLESNGIDMEAIQNSAKSLFDFDIDNPDAIQLTFASSIVLIYVIRYIADQTQDMTKKILSTFGLSIEDSASKAMGEDAWALTGIAAAQFKNLANKVTNPEEKKEDKKE